MITLMVLPTTRRDPELAEDELRALLEGLLQAGDHERTVETLVDLYSKLSRENDQLRADPRADAAGPRTQLGEVRPERAAQGARGSASIRTRASPTPEPMLLPHRDRRPRRRPQSPTPVELPCRRTCPARTRSRSSIGSCLRHEP